MPLIRLARDKRGHDTVYLLHPCPDSRGEVRMRVLYFGAAPQGLTFGRPWLDALTQRSLQARYPDVNFDWPGLQRELEQRRLPPPMEPQARRARPAKAEKRSTTSEPPTAKAPGSGKRKRRRGGGSASGESGGGDDRQTQPSGRDDQPAPPSVEP